MDFLRNPTCSIHSLYSPLFLSKERELWKNYSSSRQAYLQSTPDACPRFFRRSTLITNGFSYYYFPRRGSHSEYELIHAGFHQVLPSICSVDLLLFFSLFLLPFLNFFLLMPLMVIETSSNTETNQVRFHLRNTIFYLIKIQFLFVLPSRAIVFFKLDRYSGASIKYSCRTLIYQDILLRSS